jgi:LysR family glycine cleavage system transcriptional activator
VRRLAIHASPSFATLWLMPRLKAFIRAHPEVDVTLSSSNEPVRVGREGFDIDIQHARPVPDDCEGVLIAEELVVPLASPGLHGGAARSPARSDIARVPVIHSLRCTCAMG